MSATQAPDPDRILGATFKTPSSLLTDNRLEDQTAISLWQIQAEAQLPDWFLPTVQDYLGLEDHSSQGRSGRAAAQLLWQRGIQTPEQLKGFLNPQFYIPTSPFAFGSEMKRAVERLQQARERQEHVAIWGDFDADGITATAVLWEGLGQFFRQDEYLSYFIPNRLTESHGLAIAGIDRLVEQGCNLILTCDTGSTNLEEIQYARDLGLDVIITDHHTLPPERPPVTAIVNPRSLPPEHPLAHLAGVAVAYKLVEALYLTLPEIPEQPLENLLDLVAIGLIADLVQLTGDCRYLSQRGIEQLQKQSHPKSATRPGVARLLELCQRSGDRPTDISFGLGPRINAVSRIQGDAQVCVELLTSGDVQRCRQLAEATELANTRRKALQREIIYQVRQKLEQVDLSTCSILVLVDTQWPLGILGLVAGQIAQEYDRPTILLNADILELDRPDSFTTADFLLTPVLARGSARSLHPIDLYELLQNQAHLLTRFGGHPLAAGLTLPVANIPLLTDALNRELRQRGIGMEQVAPVLQADLSVTVSELGKDLFRELKLLEPFGIGNPVPRLLIQNCWFQNIWHRNLQDWQGRKVSYIKTEFEICDDSVHLGFPGLWWEHYKDEVPAGRCDAIVELDYNAYKKRYEVRLIGVRRATRDPVLSQHDRLDWILDWRDRVSNLTIPEAESSEAILQVTRCPTSWTELQVWFRRARQEQAKLAIAYPPPDKRPPTEIWQQLMGIGKYLSRTGKIVTRYQLSEKLGIGDRSLQLGFQLLQSLGFQIQSLDTGLQMRWLSDLAIRTRAAIDRQLEEFCLSVQAERFQQDYFYRVPLAIIQRMLHKLDLR